MAEEIEVPPYFLCPISLEIMKDPVTVSTGITFDRESIEEWIYGHKNDTCPVTKLPLFLLPGDDSDFLTLTPNVTLRRLIQSWCTLHAVQRLPTPKPAATKSQLLKILRDGAKSPESQSVCLQRLKSIANRNQTNKRCIESVGAANFLSAIIASGSRLSEEALSILCNLELSESGLKSLAMNPKFLESLIHLLHSDSYDSIAYSIVLLNSILETSDPSRFANLNVQFFTQINQIIQNGISKKVSKSTLKILMHTLPYGRNRIKASESGTVGTIIDLLLESSSDKRTIELALTVLDFLCQCAEGRSELLSHGAGMAIVSKKILRVSQVASEKSVRVLHSIGRFSATNAVLVEMLHIGVVAKLLLVMQVECGSKTKTKERAMELLKLHSRAWKNSACIPNSFVSFYPN